MLAYDLIISDEMQRLMRIMRSASSWPITDEDLIKRWIVNGICFDKQGTPEQAANMLNRELRLIRK